MAGTLTQQHVRADDRDQHDRISTVCHTSICPVFITLKSAPTLTELNASVPAIS